MASTLTEMLGERTAAGTWRACVWDPMERPHVHVDRADDGHCGPRGDLPLSRADAVAIDAMDKTIDALLAVYEAARGVLPERMEAEIGSAIQAPDSKAAIAIILSKAERWDVLRERLREADLAITQTSPP